MVNSPPFKKKNKSENAVHKGYAAAHPEVMALSTGWSFTGLCYIWRGLDLMNINISGWKRLL